jgi:hypothetical protein
VKITIFSLEGGEGEDSSHLCGWVKGVENDRAGFRTVLTHLRLAIYDIGSSLLSAR